MSRVSSWPRSAVQAATPARSSRRKLAEIGGDGNDQEFSQAFSSIAHAFIRAKAPSLLDHEQGFQLLERADDDKKAVGVLCFKVGSQHLIVPLFFLQGELKGQELLYLQEQDLFMPLKENWLNYLLNRKPHSLGDGVTRDLSHLGVRQPNLQRLRQSPYKYGSTKVSPIEMAKSAFAATALTDVAAELKAFREEMSLPKFLKQASLPMLQHLVGLFRRFPKIAADMEYHHGLEIVSEAIKLAKERDRLRKVASVLDAARPDTSRFQATGSVLNPQHPIKTGSLKIYTRHLDASAPAELDTAEQERLLRDGVLIKDAREDEDVSIPLKITSKEILTNPTNGGLFDVLSKKHGFEKCFIALKPQGANTQENFATVVSLEGEKSWINIPPGDVWVSKENLENEALLTWFDGLPKADALPEGKRARHMIVGPRGEATLPFRVEKEITEEDGSKIYEVHFDDYCRDPGPPKDYGTPNSRYHNDYDYGYDKYRDGERIHLGGHPGTKLRGSQGDLYVPEDFRLLTLKEEPKSDEDDDGPKMDGCCMSMGGSDPAPFRPGNIVDAEMEIIHKTGALKVFNDGSECEINGRRMSALAGLVHLVADHGFREKVARVILRDAQKDKVHKLRIKYALPYLLDGGPTAPAFPPPETSGQNPMSMNDRQTYDPIMEARMPIHELSAANTDPWIYNPTNYVDPLDAQPYPQQYDNGQGGHGQEELFDTSMLGSMLKTVRDDSIIDRYIPALITGMDRLGRILFMYYWHMKVFAERYGKQDLSELEDSLRNTFESMGDVVIFLKQKSIEPYPDEADMEMDLSQTADV